MNKYVYYGGYDWSINNFDANEDVIWLPNVGNEDVTVERFGNTLYVHENGGTFAVSGYFGFGGKFKYSIDGFEEIQAAIANYSWDRDWLTYSDDTVVYFGNGSTELYHSWCYDKDIRLGDTPSNGKYYIGIKDINAYYGGNSVLWGNEQDNVIKIGGNTGNNNLWGGYGGNDTLTGSEGSDLFLYESDGGHDIVTNANSNDTILFFNANPGDCGYYYDDANNIMHIYVGNGELEVNCSTGDEYYPKTYPVYQFADGSRLTYTDTWNYISWDIAEDINVDSPMLLFNDSGEFVYNYGDGRKDVLSTDNDNVIFLNNVTLNQISSAEITESGVNLKLNDGGSLNVYGQTDQFIVNGENYRADYQNKTWITES